MALGGGVFVTQNKELSGAYINFISAANANAELSDRGIATMPLELDWGVDNEIFTVTGEDFQKNSVKIFGYEYTHKKLKGLRDLFSNIHTFYGYKLTSGGAKAANDYATARYCGVRGNDLKVIIQKNTENNTLFDVKTMLDNTLIDVQTVKTAAELVDNDFLVFKSSATLAVTASTPLTGGTNGTVNGAAYQAYIDKIESYTYNSLGVVTTDVSTKSLFHAFGKRMREEMGIKFQVVLYDYGTADYIGTVNVKNKTTDSGYSEASLVYWVTGIIAGCEINRSNQNKLYGGEFTVDVGYTQTQLKAAIKAGEFTLHKVGNDIRVLEDINSKTTVTVDEGDIFKENQTVRVIDQIANDIAVLFNTKYLGVVPNDDEGRVSLWADIVQYYEELQTIRAIENFSEESVTVSEGDTKKSVVITGNIEIVNSMGKLYMTVTVA